MILGDFYERLLNQIPLFLSGLRKSSPLAMDCAISCAHLVVCPVPTTPLSSSIALNDIRITNTERAENRPWAYWIEVNKHRVVNPRADSLKRIVEIE